MRIEAGLLPRLCAERHADRAALPSLSFAALGAQAPAKFANQDAGLAVILQNIITGDFAGPVYPVNPYAAELDGIRCLPSAAALPGHVDLAVIAVPATAVLGIARTCGERGFWPV